MSSPPGVRPDLATRLRSSQHALASRLGAPDAKVALSRAAHEAFEAGRIGQLVADHAARWLDVPGCGVVAENSGGRLALLGGLGLDAAGTDLAVEVGRWVLEHGQVFSAADLSRDPRVSAGARGAILALPLQSRTQTVGALVLFGPEPAAEMPRLDGPTHELLAAALEGPALALDNAQRLHRAEALSVTDDLTKLYNSRYLNLMLRREVKRASRSGRPLSLLFIDMDGFKGVNDRHGHLAGSRALVEAAQVLQRSARETDIVARFGGDEFSVVLPDTGSDGAVAVADRVRERIAAHVFLADDGLHVRLTVSVGVATLPDVAASADELVRAADTAMYRVKDAGKNGVRIARGDNAPGGEE
jgi:diguanylate cyclase (GGDEF)-like protein